jgi:hypothetical protein
MPWLIALSVILLIVGLAGMFTISARLIHRNINDRFDRIRARLEKDATATLRNLLDEHGDG